MDTIINSDMLSSLVTTVTDNLGVILPVGISLLGIMLAIKLVPKIIKRFSR